VNGDAEDEERLGEMREIDRGLGRDVDLAHFQSPMSGITGFCLQGGNSSSRGRLARPGGISDSL
jgi:hypothetical protein